MNIGLIALDERPVNTRYPVMIAEIAGVNVLQPPPAVRSLYHSPADRTAIQAWLHHHVESLDVLIVSIETLGYGGLILSRITDDSISMIVQYIEVLSDVKRKYPRLKIYGFNLITRISSSNDSTEEPPYWATFGNKLYRYSQMFDRAGHGQDVQLELNALKTEIPSEHIHDFVKRRMRNHAVNLAVLEMLADDVFDLLVMSSDDTSEFGFGSREKRWLREWVDRRGGDERLLMYPGADEVGCALVARAISEGKSLCFAVHYAIPADQDRIAPFEDGPVSVTVERQIKAVGGVINEQNADFILAVNPPSPANIQMFDYDPEFAKAEREYRIGYLERFVNQIDEWLKEGKRIIVADVAYPNGSDPVLIDLLCQKIDLSRLAAYGGWNTAGNTIGTALAQGIASARNLNQVAHKRFLLHRFLEDWGYQHVTRQALSLWLYEKYSTYEINTENMQESNAFIEKGLNTCLQQLPGFAQQWRIVPGSVRLPWKRTFEVDFDLEPVNI